MTKIVAALLLVLAIVVFTLETILAKAGAGIRFNEHMEGDGEAVFRHACKLGLERIVSKRKDSAYPLPGGTVRWFDTRPLRPARPGYANHMDDSAERHYTKECQPS
jgi:hypothetical protein